jgi:uncharacterized protein YndB with AHSA1/START domain
MKPTETRPRVKKLCVKKLIKAKRDRVFEAWTTPELMKQWYAPDEMTVPHATSDLRVGGEYRIEMKGKLMGDEASGTVSGKYIRIVPGELLVFTWRWEGDPSPETVVTVELAEASGGTEVTVTHDRFSSAKARNKHEYGWTGCLENLALFWEAKWST